MSDWQPVEMERRGSVGPMPRGSILHNLSAGPQEFETYVPLADAKEAESVAVRRYEEVQALDEKLETLRSGLEAEVERLSEESENARLASRRAFDIEHDESLAAAWGATSAEHCNVSRRLRQLLDASEDTEA